jgi:hypothetical protein
LAFPIPLHEPWLHVTPDTSFSNAIVVARSSRYRTPEIDYSILKKYPRVVFVGLPDEFEDMHPQVPHMEYKSVANFLELAQVIAGSKLFIGNQSFPFALAEALKAKQDAGSILPVPERNSRRPRRSRVLLPAAV